jgi:hypothetical protein
VMQNNSAREGAWMLDSFTFLKIVVVHS